jgi:hypothetical protein
MYIRVKGKEEYNKIHRILTSFDEAIHIGDKEYINNNLLRYTGLILSNRDHSIWRLQYLTLHEEKEIYSLAELYDILDQTKVFHPNTDVIQIRSGDQLDYLYKYIEVKSNYETPQEIFNQIKGSCSDGYMYCYIDSNKIYGGFDRIETIQENGRNIVSFEDFYKQTNKI